YLSDAFYQNFATGVWVGNHVLDDRATWSAMVYRQDNALHGNNGADFGDGEYAGSLRLTSLPLYENEGRCLLHLGASANVQKGEHRIYDRRLGREGTAYMSGPNTPFWSVRGEDGDWSLGRGAWEAAVRFSHINLNDGSGTATGVQGGVADGIEAGLNWYMTQ